LTFSPGVDAMPMWTPDGRRIIYVSARSGVPNIYSQAAIRVPLMAKPP
jgi:Tol biopolymer transport system component